MQIWRNFEKQGADALHGDHLQTIIVECEDGKVALRRTAHLLIAMCATASTSAALLKMKILFFPFWHQQSEFLAGRGTG